MKNTQIQEACFHPLKVSQTNTDLSRAKFERDRRQCAEQEGELNRGGCCDGGEDADGVEADHVLETECSEWPALYPLCKHQVTALGPGLRVFCKQSRHFRNMNFVSSDPNVI